MILFQHTKTDLEEYAGHGVSAGTNRMGEQTNDTEARFAPT